MNFFKSIFGGGATAIDAIEANTRLNSSQPPYILDVRDQEEFKAGHLHDAHLIPVNQLSKRMSEVPQDREILCVCASGARSSMAAGMLSSAGYTVLNLRGGMGAWMAAGLPIKRD